MKLCSRNCDSIHIEIFHPSVAADGNQIVKTIPIGSYCEYSVKAPCGLVSPTHNIGHDNETDNFFDPTRFEAGLYVKPRETDSLFPGLLSYPTVYLGLHSCNELLSHTFLVRRLTAYHAMNKMHETDLRIFHFFHYRS